MNAEKLVSDYLRANGVRTVAKTPENTDDGWVRVRQLASIQPADLPTYQSLREHYFQLDCYASEDNGQPEAARAADQIASLMAVIDQADHAEGEVTACRIENGGLHNPDTAFSADRERFIVTATVWGHE